MAKKLFDGKIRFGQVRGVGTMEVDFQPNQRVYTLIGENGVGKTKFLECLFALLFFTYEQTNAQDAWIDTKYLTFKEFSNCLGNGLIKEETVTTRSAPILSNYKHSYPIVYLAAQNRGSIQLASGHISQLGNAKDRRDNYFQKLLNLFQNDSLSLKTLNMDTHIEEWIIQRAQSANPYQAKEDNRKIEIDTLLSLLNKIDNRIDGEFLEISGNNRVFVKIEGQKRELAELSSGFTSILKIMQSIIAGYSYFTNETQIDRVRGIVLIDEIESHLHNEWQVKIIPLLKKLFPNTTFVITTHSSLVISQLEQGEAYRLERSKEDGIVYGRMIANPNNSSFIDLLNEAFNVNLNSLKIQRATERSQERAKQALLELVQQELKEMGAE